MKVLTVEVIFVHSLVVFMFKSGFKMNRRDRKIIEKFNV